MNILHFINDKTLDTQLNFWSNWIYPSSHPKSVVSLNENNKSNTTERAFSLLTCLQNRFLMRVLGYSSERQNILHFPSVGNLDKQNAFLMKITRL